MVFTLSRGPEIPSDIIAHLVTIPIMMHTAIDKGSFNLRRPDSATKMSGDAQVVLTKIPDFVKSKAQSRQLHGNMTMKKMQHDTKTTYEIASVLTLVCISSRVTIPIPTVVTYVYWRMDR